MFARPGVASSKGDSVIRAYLMDLLNVKGTHHEHRHQEDVKCLPGLRHRHSLVKAINILQSGCKTPDAGVI